MATRETRSWSESCLTTLAVWLVSLGLPTTGNALAKELRFRAEVAVAIEGGPIVIKVELANDGNETLSYLDISSDKLSPLFVRPMGADRIEKNSTPPRDRQKQSAWPTPLRSGETLVTYVPLRAYQDSLKVGNRQVVINWPVYVMPHTNPDSFVIPRVHFDVITREDGVRDLSFRAGATTPIKPLKRDNDVRDFTFRESPRFEPQRRAMFREVLTIEVQPRSACAIQSIYERLVARCGPRPPSVYDDGLLDAVLSHDNEPAFDGLRAGQLAYDEYARGTFYVEQILGNCAKDPKQLDMVFANLDLNSVNAVAAILRQKPLPPYFAAVFAAKMLEAKSIWTRAMFLASYPDECRKEWREHLAKELSVCDRPVAGSAIAPLVKRLDSDRFGIREQAKRDIRAYGQRALPALREAMRKDKLSAEQAATIEGLTAELERNYPIDAPRVVTYPGLFVHGRHAFVHIKIPDALRPVQTALDQIYQANSTGTLEVLRALEQNGSESMIGREAAHLLKLRLKY